MRPAEQIRASLQEIVRAHRTGDFSRLVVHTIDIADPGRYGPKEVVSLRKRLGVSQRVFAGLLGVSVQLVEHWEQGRREPTSWARRLLDEVNRDPRHWQGMIRRSA